MVMRNETDSISRRQRRIRNVPWGAVGAFLGLVIVIAFVVQNSQQVEFTWLWWDFDAPLAVMLFLTVLLSLVCTALGTAVWRHRHREDDPPAAAPPRQ